jgi:glutamate N-acetyltransferase/amino-acid N-acetyltransferase
MSKPKTPSVTRPKARSKAGARVGSIVDRFKVPGFRASGISAGIKAERGALDLALVVSDTDATVAGVFTTSTTKAAPVILDIKRVRKGTSRGVIVNSGCANASVGKLGMKTALSMTAAVERELGVKKGAILVSSTGVIGVPMPEEKIIKAVPKLVGALSPDGLGRAATAIMTTDIWPKTVVKRARIGSKMITVAAMAKGAGMIAPNMATMLGYFFTDATILSVALASALKSAVAGSFNSIVVDNDTSTNDTVLAFANGFSGSDEIKKGTKDFVAFEKLLSALSLELALLIVADGEGATKVVEIELKGAASKAKAERIARSIAESLLVKTAFFGADPNWGRIVMAIGKSGVKINEDKLNISFNGVVVARNGLDTGAEKRAAAAIAVPDVKVVIDLNMGRGTARLWTSDIGYRYIEVNSAYRT